MPSASPPAHDDEVEDLDAALTRLTQSFAGACVGRVLRDTTLTPRHLRLLEVVSRHVREILSEVSEGGSGETEGDAAVPVGFGRPRMVRAQLPTPGGLHSILDQSAVAQRAAAARTVLSAARALREQAPEGPEGDGARAEADAHEAWARSELRGVTGAP